MHLDANRRAEVLVRVSARPRGRGQWSALGGLVGRELNDYWKIPCFVGDFGSPSPDELKFFGAALASFGSTPMFHWVGLTPEASSLEAAFGGASPQRTFDIDDAAIAGFMREFTPDSDAADVVAFSAPQLSPQGSPIWRRVSRRRVSDRVLCLATTSPMARLEGGTARPRRVACRRRRGAYRRDLLLRNGPHELVSSRGFRTIVTDSAKLANIISGYGYQPALRGTGDCVDAAISGKIP